MKCLRQLAAAAVTKRKQKKIMKNTFIVFAGAAVLTVALTQTDQAVPITGNIGFSGTADLNAHSVNTATAVVAGGWGNTTVGSDSGSFAFIPTLTPVVMTSSQWNFVSGALPAFWSVGGFTFDLASSSIFSQGGGFLNVLLAGTVSGNSYDPTAFTGSFQVANPSANGDVTFTERISFNSPVSVPDGGATVLLLGMGLVAMALLKRRMAMA